jgi:hypothetical protein
MMADHPERDRGGQPERRSQAVPARDQQARRRVEADAVRSGEQAATGDLGGDGEPAAQLPRRPLDQQSSAQRNGRLSGRGGEH